MIDDLLPGTATLAPNAGSARLAPSAPPRRLGRASVWGLVALGIVELVLCLFSLHAQDRGRINTSYAFALAQAVPYALACWLALRARPSRALLWLTLAFALVFRVVPLTQEPFFSTDIYRYVWDGRVQAAGINPYRYRSSDPALAPLRDAAVHARMNRPDARTIYPPGAEMLFFGITRFGDHPMSIRAAMVLFEAVTVWALARLLLSFGLPLQRVLLYAWHPLTIWEFAGSGHIDAAMITAAALALLAVRWGYAARAGLALAAATLIKLYPIILFPPLYRRWGWKLPLTLALLIPAAYLPYLGVGLATIFDFLFHSYTAEEGYSNGDRFFLLALVRGIIGEHFPLRVYQASVVLAFASLTAWTLFSNRATPLVLLRRASIFAVAFIGLLTPGYAWYYAWLLIFLPFFPRPGIFWLTAASYVLYANWLNTSELDAFIISSVMYLPAAALEVSALILQQRRQLLPPAPPPASSRR